MLLSSLLNMTTVIVAKINFIKYLNTLLGSEYLFLKMYVFVILYNCMQYLQILNTIHFD